MPEDDDEEWDGEPLCFGSVDQEDGASPTWGGGGVCFGTVDDDENNEEHWSQGCNGDPIRDFPALAQEGELMHLSEASTGSRMDFVLNSRDAVEVYGFEPGAGEPWRVAAFLPVQSAECV